MPLSSIMKGLAVGIYGFRLNWIPGGCFTVDDPVLVIVVGSHAHLFLSRVWMLRGGQRENIFYLVFTR